MKLKVLVSFDSMKDTNCGYYSFGKGLGTALIRLNETFNLSFYLFRKTTFFQDQRVAVVYKWLIDPIWFRKRNEFVLVHLTDQRCRLPPGNVNAKKIVTVHDFNKLHLKKSKPQRIRKFLEVMAGRLGKCDRVVAISNFVANDIIKHFPQVAHKVSVIYNGADKLVPKPGHKPALVPQRKFLFTIGLMSPQKGFHHLPCLLAGNDYQLVIAGRETEHKAVIIAEAEKYSCLDRVIFAGEISEDDKTWYYENCGALVFPSRTEGFGLPVIEAMHFGKPVFLSTYTSLPEIGGDAAYYFTDFDPEKMQQVFKAGLQHFAQNDGPQKSRDRAAVFSWDKCAGAYLDLYRELISVHR